MNIEKPNIDLDAKLPNINMDTNKPNMDKIPKYLI